MSLAVVQSKTGTASGIPGSISLTSTPTVGNLILAFVSWRDGSALPPVFDATNWTQILATPIHGSTPQMFLLGRYVQSGDGTALPAFCTSGSNFWAADVVEISGVVGAFDSDIQLGDAGWQATGATLATNVKTTSVANQLCLLAYSNYGGSALITIPSGWSSIQNTTASGTYGSWFLASQQPASSGTNVSATITPQQTTHGQAYIMLLLGAASSPPSNEDVSQVGVEAVIQHDSNMVASQIGLEVVTQNAASMKASQIGLEVILAVGGAAFTPPPFVAWIE